MKRHLAAVLAADICDYSRLMGEDSEAMLGALRRLRAEVFGPSVASRRGRIVKNMGDGWIVLFGSAADAVSSAIQVQDRLAEGARPGEPEIRMRVGVHVGDVVEEDDDVFGDGVNIAARLEQMAEPGCVAISEAVYGGTDGTLRPSFDAAGAWELKNIDWPVHVWVREAPERLPGSTGDTARLKLVIRPIETSDPRAEIRELADAITGDVGSYLTVAMWLQTATSEQSDSAQYVLDCRLRSRGERVRLEARLLDGTGTALFTEKFDGDLAEAFDWQDQVGEDLAARTISSVFDAEKSKLQNRDVADMTADECLLRSMLEGHNLDPAGIARAQEFALAALNKDPHSPDAMAQFMLMLAIMDEIPQKYLADLKYWIKASKPFLADHPFLDFLISGMGGRWLDSQLPERRRTEIERCLRRAPRDFVMLVWTGWAYLFMGETSKAADCFLRSQKIGRHSPFALSLINGWSMVHLQEGRYEKAIELARAVLAASPDYPPPSRILAAALAQSGRIEEAQKVVRHLQSLDPEASIHKFQKHTPYDDTPETRRYLDGLRMAGMPE